MTRVPLLLVLVALIWYFLSIKFFLGLGIGLMIGFNEAWSWKSEK